MSEDLYETCTCCRGCGYCGHYYPDGGMDVVDCPECQGRGAVRRRDVRGRFLSREAVSRA